MYYNPFYNIIQKWTYCNKLFKSSWLIVVNQKAIYNKKSKKQSTLTLNKCYIQWFGIWEHLILFTKNTHESLKINYTNWVYNVWLTFMDGTVINYKLKFNKWIRGVHGTVLLRACHQ